MIQAALALDPDVAETELVERSINATSFLLINIKMKEGAGKQAKAEALATLLGPFGNKKYSPTMQVCAVQRRGHSVFHAGASSGCRALGLTAAAPGLFTTHVSLPCLPPPPPQTKTQVYLGDTLVNPRPFPRKSKTTFATAKIALERNPLFVEVITHYCWAGPGLE